MPSAVVTIATALVALRKESVDRNSQNYSYKITEQVRRSPQGEHGMFIFLTVQGGFVHADIRFNFKNCYRKKLSHKIKKKYYIIYLTRYPGGVYSEYTPPGYLVCDGRVT